MIDKIKNFFIKIYTQMVTMDDSPHRIALGFGVGVFLGILPGTGPLAALAAAYIFRLNKAATFLGSILTNAWLSIVTFVISIKIGCAVLGIEVQAVIQQAQDLIQHFSWKAFFDVSLLHILKPLFVGFMIVGFLCGLLAYGVVLLILLKKRQVGR